MTKKKMFDIYKMKNGEFYHGDCLKVMQSLPDNEIILAFTSPPYFNAINYEGHIKKLNNEIERWEREEVSYEEYKQFLVERFTELYRIMKPGGHNIVNISPTAWKGERTPLAFHFVKWMEEIGWKFKEDIIWEKEIARDKRSGVLLQHPYPGYYYPSLVVEYNFVFQKPASKKKENNIYWFRTKEEKETNKIDLTNYQGEMSKNVWKIRPVAPQENIHPCPFPVELAERIIRLYSYKGDTVIDIFAGSGQACLAAIKLGRRFIGIDTVKHYLDYAIEKIKNLERQTKIDEFTSRKTGQLSEGYYLNEKEISFTAKIKNIKYTPLMIKEDLLKEYTFEQFQQGEVGKSQFLLRVKNNLIAISRWVSPKRTRSYPYVRVYETLGHKNRITIIPLVKDEGIGGDRDFLQWDTVSLMSLLGVYVIIAYYTTAEPNPKPEYAKTKITNQEFDYEFLSKKIIEYLDYKSDALHWNLKQLDELTEVAQSCEQKYYEEISPTLGIKMHNRESFRRKIKEIITSSERFKQFSRGQAQEAQDREVKTIQPKELLSSNPKAKLTIRNYLGGAYYFTADECLLHKNRVFLIEKKHSKGQMPSANDIKDGIIKMILFTNLEDVKVETQDYRSYPVLGLTAKDFPGIWTSWGMKQVDMSRLSKGNIELITKLKREARTNIFYAFILNEKYQKEQNKILGSIIGENDLDTPIMESK